VLSTQESLQEYSVCQDWMESFYILLCSSWHRWF